MELSQHIQSTRAEASPDVDGRALFARDMRVALALLNDARYRSMERFLGVPREQANLATLVALLIVAEGMRRRAARALTLPGAPSFDGVVVAGASMRQVIWQATGMPGEEPPLFGPLIALAVVVSPTRRVVMRSAHRMRGSLHQMAVGFHHRYGYLVDPGHLRSQRAKRKELASGTR